MPLYDRGKGSARTRDARTSSDSRDVGVPHGSLPLGLAEDHRAAAGPGDVAVEALPGTTRFPRLLHAA